jgi:osmotically-inducible protein OsmY
MIVDEQDADLKDAVLGQLRADPRVNEAEIGVAVEKGVVTLTGRVGSEAEKVAAGEAAHRAAGVLDVANDIRVRAPFALGRNDTDLAEAVREALDRAVGPAARHIQSTVDDGRVTLEGVVDVSHQREEAERAVRRVAFVLDVANELVVGVPAGRSA